MSASQLEFVTGFYHSMDTENKELFVQKYYHPEATFVFGPMPPVHGIEEITKKYVEQVPTKHFNIKVVSESDGKCTVRCNRIQLSTQNDSIQALYLWAWLTLPCS